MIKKPVFPKILLLILLYCLVFILLVMIQFPRHGDPAQGRRILTSRSQESPFEVDPGEFVIAQARTRRDYDTALNRWRDQNFSQWNRIISQANDEDIIIAFIREAMNRQNYKPAVSAITPAFLNSGQRSYQSTVYLGQLDSTYKSLINADKEKLNVLARLINDKSPDFLKEPRVFEYFAVRGFGNLVEEGEKIIRSLDTAALDQEIIPGIFESYLFWKNNFPQKENPFENFLDEACLTIYHNLKQNQGKDRVLVFSEDRADTVLNLRLGKSLLNWAESEEDESWASLARSIIISVLLESNAGSIRGAFLVSDQGETGEDSSAPTLSTARLYRILGPGEYSPRALAVNAENNIWAWTASQTISAAENNNVLDISASFPAGETHYMIFRGIRSFAKIQLYDMDFRTDPQFERYDSSGWSYVPAEQCLLVKMKHRTTVEHIRIFF